MQDRTTRVKSSTGSIHLGKRRLHLDEPRCNRDKHFIEESEWEFCSTSNTKCAIEASRAVLLSMKDTWSLMANTGNEHHYICIVVFLKNKLAFIRNGALPLWWLLQRWWQRLLNFYKNSHWMNLVIWWVNFGKFNKCDTYKSTSEIVNGEIEHTSEETQSQLIGTAICLPQDSGQ